MTRLPAARPTRHDEETAQRLVIARCDRLIAAYPALQWLYHPANGGKRDARTAALLKAQGVRRGVPDLIMPVRCPLKPDVPGWAAELKIAPNRASAEQAAWIDHYEAQGWYVRLHRACDARSLADQVCLDLWSYLAIPERAYIAALLD